MYKPSWENQRRKSLGPDAGDRDSSHSLDTEQMGRKNGELFISRQMQRQEKRLGLNPVVIQIG